MDASVEEALKNDTVIDITTTGRKSGEARRIEIWFHNLDSRYFITGRPGRRSWYANLLANPDFVFHLKESTQAELSATARAITSDTERREILEPLIAGIGDDSERPLDQWLERAPLVEVTFN
ncbi:MAG: nitroreductase family deazaflavin-dependent oxidoreductase [Chloroflexi bacterium]|nr:nitroreductase family deazaflavin-dependent oxidoreductase [Chloroflexota bacterium]